MFAYDTSPSQRLGQQQAPQWYQGTHRWRASKSQRWHFYEIVAHICIEAEGNQPHLPTGTSPANDFWGTQHLCTDNPVAWEFLHVLSRNLRHHQTNTSVAGRVWGSFGKDRAAPQRPSPGMYSALTSSGEWQSWEGRTRNQNEGDLCQELGWAGGIRAARCWSRPLQTSPDERGQLLCTVIIEARGGNRKRCQLPRAHFHIPSPMGCPPACEGSWGSSHCSGTLNKRLSCFMDSDARGRGGWGLGMAQRCLWKILAKGPRQRDLGMKPPGLGMQTAIGARPALRKQLPWSLYCTGVQAGVARTALPPWSQPGNACGWA